MAGRPNDESSGEEASGQEGAGRTIAVALEYTPDEAQAPRVVATGRDSIAEQILEIAFAAGIKVREDADLAQILSAVEVDSEIPVEAFAAVAEILVYLYYVNGNAPNVLREASEEQKPGPTGP